MFSKRTGWDLAPNALSEKRRELQAGGVALLDLVESNPTRVGIPYPEGIFQRLADPAAGRYDPDPRGLSPAREAIARLFSDKGAPLRAERVLLTASTSEAYTWLFRLLADPGESVLVPRPSYPLLQYLAELSDVKPVPYPLRFHADGGWRIDFDALDAAAARGARAAVVVHPNNPTGSAVRKEELDRLTDLCRTRRMALITDEVFAEYLFSPSSQEIPATLLGERGILLFALGGLSKFLGLPQMKVAWTACGGPEELVEPALARLELIADSLLSVNTPAQAALPQWLEMAGVVQARIQGRLETNRRTLAEECCSGGWRALAADGGWSAVLKNGALQSWEEEERWVLSVLEEAHVLTYPGSFFDFDEPGHAVVSLLAEPESFSEGIRRLIRATP